LGSWWFRDCPMMDSIFCSTLSALWKYTLACMSRPSIPRSTYDLSLSSWAHISESWTVCRSRGFVTESSKRPASSSFLSPCSSNFLGLNWSRNPIGITNCSLSREEHGGNQLAILPALIVKTPPDSVEYTRRRRRANELSGFRDCCFASQCWPPSGVHSPKWTRLTSVLFRTVMITTDGSVIRDASERCKLKWHRWKWQSSSLQNDRM